MTYLIIEADEGTKTGYQPYGAAKQLWQCRDRTVVISGPAETGKTLGALQKLDAFCWKYPGLHALLLRKIKQDLYASAIKIYQDKVLLENSPIEIYGGQRPEHFDYPTKARIVVGGLDKPGKVLSAEYDVVLIIQGEELALNDFEMLTTRCTGRAGNMPYSQIIIDCNPGPRHHWIKELADAGKITFLESRHEDNPTLFDPQTGLITEQGKITLEILDNLTGVRYQRLRLGKWVSAEGQIYSDYDPVIHLIDRFDIPEDWTRIRVIDFGLVHPFVCGWWAIDGDGRAYLYREIYMTGRTVATHAKDILRLSEKDNELCFRHHFGINGELNEDQKLHLAEWSCYKDTICDHDAEDRQTLAENGIPNIPARKDVLQGIGKVQDRFKVQKDGKPRIFFLRNSLVEVDQSLKLEHKPYSTVQEIDGYIWKNNARKEEPVKEDDHGMDMVRYMVMYLDGPSKWRSMEFLRV